MNTLPSGSPHANAGSAAEVEVPVPAIDLSIYVMPAFATLTVSDLAASRRWYVEGLGFAVLAEVPDPSGGVVLRSHLINSVAAKSGCSRAGRSRGSCVHAARSARPVDGSCPTKRRDAPPSNGVCTAAGIGHPASSGASGCADAARSSRVPSSKSASSRGSAS